jgi:leucyl aminopeptidase
VAARLAEGDPARFYFADQYRNPANWQAHFAGTGPEILRQTRHTITHFVAGLGTTGTMTGVGRYLRAEAPTVRLVAVQPDGPLHGLEGLKHLPTAHVPEIFDPSLPDETVIVDTESAYAMARRLARREGWSFRFYDERALARLGAGAFLAVARANEHRGAGIARLTYRPRGARRRIGLVGKGICFDTGGINLKSHKGMYQMHGDMQGSAVAVGTLLALARRRAPLEIDCWLALTENQIGPRAYRPQEVVRASNGVTIQVVHSDAEGRMVLADTLALASRARPRLLLDFATLTGACVNALPDRYSGVFTNRAACRGELEGAGRASGERGWGIAMDPAFADELDSPVADVMQCALDNKGDHILAARFLSRFVPGSVAWAHVDLSASERKGGLAHVPSEFTGFGVRFATQLIGDGAVIDRLEPGP